MYSWVNEYNTEIWNNGMFDTVEECIKDATYENFIEDNISNHKDDVIYVGECIPVNIHGIYLDDVLERVEETMYEEIGEVAKGWDIASTNREYQDRKPIYDKYQELLEDLVLNYIKEIGEKPNFFKIMNIKEVRIGEMNGSYK